VLGVVYPPSRGYRLQFKDLTSQWRSIKDPDIQVGGVYLTKYLTKVNAKSLEDLNDSNIAPMPPRLRSLINGPPTNSPRYQPYRRNQARFGRLERLAAQLEEECMQAELRRLRAANRGPGDSREPGWHRSQQPPSTFSRSAPSSLSFGR
jgi:hypothetical protein